MVRIIRAKPTPLTAARHCLLYGRDNPVGCTNAATHGAAGAEEEKPLPKR
jgi:hypothetical protein